MTVEMTKGEMLTGTTARSSAWRWHSSPSPRVS